MSITKTTDASRSTSGSTGPLEVRGVTTAAGTFAEARDRAQDEGEPVFVPVTPFVDDRGWSYMNMMTEVMSGAGQINVSMQHPGVVRAWHRHDRQTDFWFCFKGEMKAGVYRERDHVAWLHVFGERRPGVLVIPPPLWHGAATVGSEPAGLLYYVTHAYDRHQPDELRRAWDSVTDFPWATRHG